MKSSETCYDICLKGENDKQAMLDLEMADMRRSLEGLKEKLETKSKQNDILSGQLETAKNERGLLQFR